MSFSVPSIHLARLCAGLCALTIAIGCRSGSEPAEVVEAPVDVGAETGVADATESPEPDPGPAVLPAKIHAVSAEGLIPLSPDTTTEAVPPDSRFEIELPRLADVRVRLFDASDRVVPSNDTLELTGATARYVLVPAEPLVTGSNYSLLIDGQRGELATDSDGKVYAELRARLKTSGEKPAPQKKQPPKRRRRR